MPKVISEPPLGPSPKVVDEVVLVIALSNKPEIVASANAPVTAAAAAIATRVADLPAAAIC